MRHFWTFLCDNNPFSNQVWRVCLANVSLSNYLYFPDLGVLDIKPTIDFNVTMSSDVKREPMVIGAKDPDLM